ncbi:hypothetical protein [Pectobacterium odoriferum]|uniref:Fimbrial protein n=1 Tax=Pectobacterium odoriferum TaxID=78398 RepID=A0ABR4VPP5_9GAMM|nr:hypothetical protein [Pectobacterium odoriferum]KGA32968.1 hypothetical protein KS43_15860 [Pectobacterium odoriferum]KGA41358.1 hypothetical protein KU75_11245 [Pectobacterium odoriferum]MBA0188844.1 hypothetical protein [Pectobacterium odoriferum]MCA6961220.1 hypothetical protein [Pectobacterium odoriferum]MCH5009330.1 hypothetical protein [Pectobacterium odoriferum]
MKTKLLMTAMAGLLASSAAFAATPGSYDTKFNVSANVPDSARITDPSGRPVTELDVVLEPAPSGKMEAQTVPLKLWNNNVSNLDISLKLDDSQSADGSKFTLYGTDGNTLSSLTYQINTITEAGAQNYVNSGESKVFSLKAASANHAELPIVFKFVSDNEYEKLGTGKYTGVVYANVTANP